MNDLSVKNRLLFNFYKKKTAWQFGIRSHVKQDLISFIDLISSKKDFSFKGYHLLLDQNFIL